MVAFPIVAIRAGMAWVKRRTIDRASPTLRRRHVTRAPSARCHRMNTDPQPPRKPGRLFLIVGCLILAIIVIAFWGLNISHYAQMQGR